MKLLVLLFMSFSVSATVQPDVKRKAPLPDKHEYAEMVCFKASQAMYKVLENVRGGMDADEMAAKIKLNAANEKRRIKNHPHLLKHLEGVTKLALDMVALAKNLDPSIKPQDAQTVYYDTCVDAVHEHLKKTGVEFDSH